MSSDTSRRRGLMLVISSPSGAGKTSLSRRLMEAYPDVLLSVSATTRNQRPGEVDGQDYNFVDVRWFRRMVELDAFLEWARVFDHYYGTPRADTESRLHSGKDVIFDVDWQGADALHDQMPRDVVSVFVLPPSIAALKARLGAREGMTPEGIERRMQDAKSEIRHWRRYDYCIINDDFDAAYADLERILLVERRKRLRQRDLDGHVRALLDET